MSYVDIDSIMAMHCVDCYAASRVEKLEDKYSVALNFIVRQSRLIGELRAEVERLRRMLDGSVAEVGE